jgi:peptide/nickel transport system permease protein
MGRFIVRRLLWVVLVLLVVTLLTFGIFFMLPTQDPAIAMAGRQPTPERVAEIREQLGLDQSVPKQYYLFVKRIVVGDEYGWPGLGYSYDSQSPVSEQLWGRLWISTQLAIGSAVVWLAIGVPVGIVSALKRRTLADRLSMGFALFGVSAPVFWLGLVFLYVFWQKLGIASGTGFVPFTEDPGSWFNHLLMPWIVVALLFAAFYARMIRGNLIETMGEDYIRTARAKGLSERKVIGKHALRSSLTPIVTMFGMDLSLLVGGALLTETVFNIPGIGVWTVQSTFNGDLPVILAVVLIVAFMVTIMNLFVDILYAYLDPRVRYS